MDKNGRRHCGPSPSSASSGERRRIPWLLKIIYTLYVAILVPFYWGLYGPTNFLYLCDLALLGTVPALWLDSRRLINMWTVMILIPQTIWIIDFVVRAVSGWSPLGMTGYMFDSAIPLFIRGLSTFHLWLPVLLLALTGRMGYDPRTLPLAIALGEAVLLFCYFVLPLVALPAPGAQGPININYVYGLNWQKPQTWMPPLLWLVLLLIFYAGAICWPAHALLKQVNPANAPTGSNAGS